MTVEEFIVCLSECRLATRSVLTYFIMSLAGILIFLICYRGANDIIACGSLIILTDCHHRTGCKLYKSCTLYITSMKMVAEVEEM